MALRNRTYRVVDGEQIEGTWRPVFIRNGPAYFLTDLLIYADGAIYCWEWVDLDGLREKLASGWVATHIEEGASASAHHLASWRFGQPTSWVSAEDLLGEVADEIDRLNDRPDATGRCHAALGRYLASRTETDRQALREAYLAIPEHLRHYALGDMDAKDGPLRVLSTPSGERTTHGELVTEEMIGRAVGYFEERAREGTEWEESRPVDGSAQPRDPAVVLTTIPGRWAAEPSVEWLRNEFPVPIELGGVVHKSVLHAYWWLATTDEHARAEISAATPWFAVETAAGRAPIRAGWADMRTAAMHAVLRAKFGQHPELAEILLGTGDGRIEYSAGSAYWSGGKKGRNWVGRLLELVRAEIAARRGGLEL